jgi:hypothetical protein
MATLGIAEVLNQWQSVGIFDYLLPALLIFAIVFAILNKSKVLGEERKIQVIVALTISLLALQGGVVQRYFPPLFSKLGVGLAILVILLVMTGILINDEEKKYWYWGFGAIGMIIAIVIVSQSFEEAGYGWAGYYTSNAGWIIGGVLVVGVIIALASAGGKEKKE